MSDDENKPKDINIILDRTQVEQNLQEELDREKEASLRLKIATERLIGKSIGRKATQEEIAEYLLNEKLPEGKESIYNDSRGVKGGGVIRLDEHKNTKEGQYDTPEEAFNDLKLKASRNDRVAKEQLDRLKEMATKSVIKDYLQNGRALHLVQCPVCQNMIDYGAGERVCPKCGWDKFKGYDG